MKTYRIIQKKGYPVTIKAERMEVKGRTVSFFNDNTLLAVCRGYEQILEIPVDGQAGMKV